jgi:hypothetical protein
VTDNAEPRRIKANTWFREELDRLETQVLGGLDLVASQLDRALDAITFQRRWSLLMIGGSTDASSRCTRA